MVESVYHFCIFPYVPCDFTGTIAGNRHYSTSTIEGPLLYDRLLVHEEETNPI